MNSIPQAFNALASYSQFVVGKIIPKLDSNGIQQVKPNGALRWDKIPCDAQGNPLAWTKPENLLSLTEAIQRRDDLQVKYPTMRLGLGYIFRPEDGFVFIDLDQALAPCGRVWNDLANSVMARFPGAAVEISSSCTGLHIVFRANSLVKTKCKNSDGTIELYTGKKFMMFGQPNAIGDCGVDHTVALHAFINEMMLDSDVSQTGTGDLWRKWEIALSEAIHPQCVNPIQNDSELIEAIIKSSRTPDIIFTNTKSKFEKLWEGNTEEYETLSEADAALATILCWWTGGHAERIEKLMWQSALIRDKWERADYLPRTILFARGKNTTYYIKEYHHKSLGVNATPAPVDSQTQTDVNSLPRVPLQKYQYGQLTESGKVIDGIPNLIQLLNYWGITARWNSMKREREVIIPGLKPFLDDHENYILSHLFSIAGLNNYPLEHLDSYMNAIAQDNSYHPFVECLIQQPWDGIPRLDKFIASVVLPHDAFAALLLRKWMLSTMASIHSINGFSQQGVLVLQGAQGVNKTRFIKSLDPINCGAVKEGAILDVNNKDNIITHSKHAIVEIAELDGTMRKNDIARLKAFITTSSDEVRFPFARKNTILPRRTSYIATVNDPRFLNDNTGSRRFHTIEVGEINLDHGINIQQVWAEVEFYRQGGETTWLNKDHSLMLSESNSKHEYIDPVEEKLLSFFDWSEGWMSRTPIEMTCTGVLEMLGYTVVSRSQATRMSSLLKKYAVISDKRRYYFVPIPRKK